MGDDLHMRVCERRRDVCWNFVGLNLRGRGYFF